jgi:hypothetical protein
MFAWPNGFGVPFRLLSGVEARHDGAPLRLRVPCVAGLGGFI